MTQSVVSIENNLECAEIIDIPINTLELEEPNPEFTIYIDKDISYYLNAVKYESKSEFIFPIDDQFCDDVAGDDDYVQFKVYAEEVCNEVLSSDESDLMASDELSDDDVDDHKDEEELEYSIEIIPLGVIINSIIYLSYENWHTITDIDDEALIKCAVCEIYTSLNSSRTHIESFTHNLSLNRYKPLKRYDLNIIRKINNVYHCGQCNELIPIHEINKHSRSQTHKKSLLLSINKASKYLCPNETNNNTDDENRNDCDDSNDNTLNNNNTFNVISYASIAKKPKAKETPKYLFKDIGTKTIKILFDSWHMLAVTNTNKIHCMACNISEHLRYKAKHCEAAEHIENLMKCIVIEEFKHHFVRQVSNCESMYHCSHCNNIQYKFEMERHLILMHPKHDTVELKISSDSRETMSPISDSGSKSTLVDDKNALSNNKNALNNDKNDLSNDKNALNNDKNALINDKNALSNDKNALSTDKAMDTPENDKIMLHVFGYDTIISVLSYNTIMKNQFSYFCGLCAKPLKENQIRLHIQDLRHIMLLQTTPYNSIHGIHLLRVVADFIHCTICNAHVLSNEIYLHIVGPTHRTLLAQTINVPLERLPSFLPQMPPSNGHQSQIPVRVPNAPQILPYPPQILPYAPQMLPYPPQMSLFRPQNISTPNTVQNIKFVQTYSENQYRSVRPFSPPPFRANNESSPFFRPQSPSAPVINLADTGTLGDEIGNSFKVKSSIETQSINKELEAQNVLPTVNISEAENVLPSENIYEAKNVLPTENMSEAKRGIETQNINRKQKAQNVLSTEHIPMAKRAIETRKQLAQNVLPAENVPKAKRAIAVKSFKLKSKVLESSECQSVDPVSLGSDGNSDESMDPVEVYDTEKYIYLKLRNIYFKITCCAYNGLVHVGDGTRYCFICACNVGKDLKKHVDSRSHMENIDKYHFVDKYEKHLLRQAYLTYHCCICNVILNEKELKKHIEWPTHALEMQIAHNTAKKLRRKDIDAGIKLFTIKIGKEQIYLNMNVAKNKILLNAKILKGKGTESQSLEKSKMISYKNNVLKFSFRNWHGLMKVLNETKCFICDINIDGNNIMIHVEQESHRNNLTKAFMPKYLPALIRQVNDTMSHCIYCNVKLLNTHINVHIRGRRHEKNVQLVHDESASAKNYEDCEGVMLTV